MFLFLFCLVQLSDVSFGQKLDRIERELAETMLKNAIKASKEAFGDNSPVPSRLVAGTVSAVQSGKHWHGWLDD